MSRRSVDFAVAGAGVVGITAALLLARNGYTVALVDPSQSPPPRPRLPAFDIRTYALTPASLRLLAALGADAMLDAERLAPFHGMHVWDARSNGVLCFEAGRLGRASLGTIVEHANLHGALHALAPAVRGLERITAAVDGIGNGERVCELELDNGDRISASLVVACDGANSALRAALGIVPEGGAFGQDAVICNVDTEFAHESIARQRFLPDGPLAFLPLPPPASCSIVWTTTPEHAAALVNADDDDFMAELTDAFGGELGAVRGTTARMAVPLTTLHARQYTSGRAVLLGDAAHVVHPLAGQGLNLGLMDAAALAEVFDHEDELDCRFPQAPLRRFSRMRRGENLAMLKTTSALNRLFRDDHGLVHRLRGAGMQAVNRLEPLKTWLMLRAMGDVGDVPSIAVFDSGRPD